MVGHRGRLSLSRGAKYCATTKRYEGLIRRKPISLGKHKPKQKPGPLGSEFCKGRKLILIKVIMLIRLRKPRPNLCGYSAKVEAKEGGGGGGGRGREEKEGKGGGRG